jgi:hypothetical protein
MTNAELQAALNDFGDHLTVVVQEDTHETNYTPFNIDTMSHGGETVLVIQVEKL